MIYAVLLFLTSFYAQHSPYAYVHVVKNAIGMESNIEKIDVFMYGKKGCRLLLLEKCASFRVNEIILENPAALEKAMDSVVHPCHYLANPNLPVPEGDERLRKWKSDGENASSWRNLHCDAGLPPDEPRVVLNVVDGNQEIVLQIIKP